MNGVIKSAYEISYIIKKSCITNLDNAGFFISFYTTNYSSQETYWNTSAAVSEP